MLKLTKEEVELLQAIVDDTIDSSEEWSWTEERHEIYKASVLALQQKILASAEQEQELES